MATVNLLKIKGNLPLVPQNAGLFISHGEGIHPNRVINSYELIFVRQGLLGMFEADRRFELRAGQTLLLWPGRKHGGTIPYPRDLSFYWIHFTLNPNASKCRSSPLFSVPQAVTLHRPERLTELFRRFLDDQESDYLTPVSGTCLVIQMLTEVSRGSKNARFFESPSYAFLASRAEDYIRTHFDKSNSARDIARALQCNPDYLGRVFRLAFGCTLTERLHQRRIRKAQSLLMDSMSNVNEIAQACGFNDVVYFRRIFERHCNMTPRDFRKLYTRVHINTI
jgi:AraC-like DNA-binding protein